MELGVCVSTFNAGEIRDDERLVTMEHFGNEFTTIFSLTDAVNSGINMIRILRRVCRTGAVFISSWSPINVEQINYPEVNDVTADSKRIHNHVPLSGG